MKSAAHRLLFLLQNLKPVGKGATAQIAAGTEATGVTRR